MLPSIARPAGWLLKISDLPSQAIQLTSTAHGLRTIRG